MLIVNVPINLRDSPEFDLLSGILIVNLVLSEIYLSRYIYMVCCGRHGPRVFLESRTTTFSATPVHGTASARCNNAQRANAKTHNELL